MEACILNVKLVTFLGGILILRDFTVNYFAKLSVSFEKYCGSTIIRDDITISVCMNCEQHANEKVVKVVLAYAFLSLDRTFGIFWQCVLLFQKLQK